MSYQTDKLIGEINSLLSVLVIQAEDAGVDIRADLAEIEGLLAERNGTAAWFVLLRIREKIEGNT